MVTAPSRVRVGPRGVRRITRSLHPWVFRDDVQDTGGASSGDVVRVVSSSGRPLGHAFYSERSRIALRLLSRGEAAVDRAFWWERVAAALAHRERVVAGTDAYRLLFGESDGIPGLVADRYRDHLVVQTLTPGAERVLPEILELLEERVPLQSVLARNDPAVRSLEGMPREIRQIRGTTPREIEVREGEVRYLVDPWSGQKTGAFLDQRENRAAAAGYCEGRVLDVFAYHGSFALHAARRETEVEAVESSADAVARGEHNVSLNGLANVTFRADNAFEDLRRRVRREELFDAIVVDPPAFAKRRSDVPAARRGYKEINLRAMRLLSPGGVLVTCSCSYNLGEEDWIELLTAAALDAGKQFRVLEKRVQSRDHPIRLGFPESYYLKCMILAVS